MRGLPLRPPALAALALGGCAGPQSTLDPAGNEAERFLELLYVVSIGGALIWLFVVSIAIYAGLRSSGEKRVLYGNILILGGGVVFPTAVLAALLFYAIGMMSELRAEETGEFAIRISGERFWWRITYETPSGPVETANELHLPVNEAAALLLTSPDVIHSFWVPAIAGKLDMIPGRETRLVVSPERVGSFRGQCAEYCGTSHALMAFETKVTSRADFDEWLRQEAAPAAEPTSAEGARGREVFMSVGCGACHAVRGTAARGRMGPDLTHVGSRGMIAAATLANDTDELARWTHSAPEIKPDIEMPAYDMLSGNDLRAIAQYLKELK